MTKQAEQQQEYINQNAQNDGLNQKQGDALPPKPKRSKGGIIFVALLILIFGGLAAWRILTPEKGLEPLPEQAVQVYTAVAKIDSISINTTLTGKVQAADEAAVYASGGEVRHINVEVGDYVTKGQRLFSLDTTQIQGSYTQAQVARDLAREGVATARQNLERMRTLYDSAAIPVSQLEQAESALTSAELQLRQAEAAVSSAASSIGLMNFDSPINGYVTEVNLTEGMYPGQLPAVSIASLDDLKIAASVSEYLIGTVKEGAPVSFKITSLSAAAFTGEIKKVALAPATGGLTYPIEVAISEKDAGIMPGMFAELSLPANHKDQALVIPTAALITRSGQNYVAVLEDGDLPYLREVQIGLNNGVMVEITEGLSDGETVITKGQHFIVEGEAVVRLAE